MGRPPHGGGPVFRFTQNEVMEMEACLQEANNAVPAREIINSLAEKFSVSADRSGKIIVQPKQVWNWFQNRRYAQRAKLVKAPGKLSVSPIPRDDSVAVRNVAQSAPAASGKNSGEDMQMEFEAKSARDGAWYDVASFISHRYFETGDPEVRVRFTGFGIEEDEWINVRKCVRQRSLPCEASECAVVLPGDLILCFQEGKEQALYFDAHVLDAQRRRHDVRGCRCRFLVRYDHDQSEEIVPLRKICRRPETDYRLRILHASKASGSTDPKPVAKDSSLVSPSKEFNLVEQTQKTKKQRKMMDINTDEVMTPLSQSEEPMAMEATGFTTAESAVSDAPMGDAAPASATGDIPREENAASTEIPPCL